MFQKITHDADGCPIAEFSTEFFDPLPFPLKGGGLGCFTLLIVHINLASKKVITTSLDGEPITIRQALLLVGHLMTWHSHAWLHALAMWGCDQGHPIPWVATMSMYSYFMNH